MRERLREAENGITNLIEEILTKDKATTPPQDQEPLSLSPCWPPLLPMIESSEVLTWEVRAAVNQLIKHI